MATTLFLSHKKCQYHDMGQGHPESPLRLQAIEHLVRATDWQDKLRFADAPKIDLNCLTPIHPKHHIQALMELVPQHGFADIDGDTRLNPYSLDAALYAVGAALHATDEVIAGRAKNAFCAVRPPGHHAESAIAMGFCLFNSVALAAERALASGMSRVAIVDFDVHHGNGTVEIFQNRPEVLVCSSFQYPFYPGRFDDVIRPNICLTPLKEGSDGAVFRKAVEHDWTRAVRQHQPEMIFVSAGFDAHRDDPLGGLKLDDGDFLTISQLITELAMESAGGRVVSLLEGGYQLQALSRSVVQHLKALTE